LVRRTGARAAAGGSSRSSQASSTSNRASRAWSASAFERARLKADMPHVNFHDLRHSCASILVGLGVDLYTVSKILGHSNTQTTQRYAHLQIGQQRNALNKLSDAVRKSR